MLLEKFNKITTFVFDVDGVLTDGTVMVLENGLQARRMNIKDGFALQMAIKNGYRVKIISGGNSPEVKDRLEKLGVKDVDMAVVDKRELLIKYMATNELKKEEVIYMGDDLPDLPALQEAGMACCPADAVTEIREMANYISPFNGGMACVRDVIEKVLKLKGQWKYKMDIASK